MTAAEGLSIEIPIRLDIKAGDTFVVTVDDRLSADQHNYLEQHIAARLPAGVKVLILDGGIKPHVASATSAAGPNYRDKPAESGNYLCGTNTPQAFLDWLGVPRDTRRLVLTIDVDQFATVEITRAVPVDLDAAEQLEAATGRRYELREIPVTKEPQA